MNARQASSPAAATTPNSAAAEVASTPPSAPPTGGMLTTGTPAAPQLRQSQAQDLVGQLLDYQNQVGAGATLPPQMREALVSMLIGGTGLGQYQNDEDPYFGNMVLAKLNAKSDADLIGAAAAHAEHVRDPSGNFLGDLMQIGMPIAAAFFGGPIGGALAGTGSASVHDGDPVTGAIIGGGTAAVAPGITDFLGGGMLGQIGAGAVLGGGTAAITGKDIGKGAVIGAAGGAIPGIADVIAPALSDIAKSLGLTPEEMAGVEDSLKNTLDISPSTEQTIGEIGASKAREAFSAGMLPGMGSDVLKNLDQQDAEALSKQPAVTGQDLQKYAKIAQQVGKLLGNSGGQPTGPQRVEGQSDEQYAQQLVQYLNLDAAAMAAQGLIPGTPEYYQYIMSQADAVIQQVLGGMDVNANDLSAQLQGHTQQELEQLQRALFVRGQMDTLVGPGSYTDPFTGRSQDVSGPAGSRFQPSVGAYQRGLAHSTDELAGLRGTAALDYLHGMLGRNVDLFGMQGNQDARMLQARLEEMQQPQQHGKKRNGMLGDIGYWQQELNALSPDQLQALMHSMGGDESRTRAALEQLLGIPGYSG